MLIALLQCKILLGQTSNLLVGSWILQYSLQSSNKSCSLPRTKDTLFLSANSKYSWNTNGGIIKGKWRIKGSKINLYSSKAINFEGTIADVLYPFELKNKFLIIHQPSGGDISCPNLYYKKRK
jgi:hypothetical protein